jgi:methyl-accepting chemotaxis protein
MLKNMKLGTKIGLGFGVVLVLMIGIATLSLVKMSGLNADMDVMVSDRFPKTVLANDITDNINQVARSARNIVIMVDQAGMEKEAATIKEAMKVVNDRLEKLGSTIKSVKGKEILKSVLDARAAYSGPRDEAVKLALEGKKQEATAVLLGKLRPLQLTYMKQVDQLVQYQAELMKEAGKEAKETYVRSRTFILLLSLISLLLGCGLAYLITRSITRPINKVAEGLSDGAEQVASASTQVASASQSLAEGASEQAAGLEETSSSMEEMSSMTKQNADNANQANTLMRNTTQVVEEANQAMKDLTRSMGEISAASEETGKIIKTIDEIAFQTNLLALNAAVEAARAGEAGAGFAVVADEVRNLAMRAAEAAKNTSNLIEGTVKKIKNGSDIVSKTNEAFEKVAGGSRKVAELVSEITAASQEQAQGIDQISKAVSEMDRVVQQNAASAEESASASEEMNAQAEQMKEFVAELMAVIGGNGLGNGYHSYKALPTGRETGKGMLAIGQNGPSKQHKALLTSGPKGKNKNRITAAFKEVSPEKLIPLEEGEFNSF